MNDWKEKWQDYADENTYGHPSAFFEDEGWEQIQSEVVGTWRWGTIHEDVWQHPDGTLLGVDYQDASGDGDIDLDGMGVEIYPVVRREVVTVKYLKV